eukprot:CAMPEP_0170590872 /NCGR_PEP_ID=MMETSP0224-20130122/12100_1 /TAXON_ID=285029 /ORGANISM="Togula jolla, Strain CCCM 725" /LENGTH=39 /DNA_ID= /DNA_START= /DNA_END= /DNA_ORIENTATION=
MLRSSAMQRAAATRHGRTVLCAIAGRDQATDRNARPMLE